MTKDAVIKALSALAHPKRLDVFRLLVVAGSEGTTPGVLMEQLQVPSATMSAPPMCTAVRVDTICSSTPMPRRCASARAPPTPP